MSRAHRENQLLSWLSAITSVGDWLTYFAVLKIGYSISGSVALASLSMASRSLAIAVSAIAIPLVLDRWGTKRILTVSQWMGVVSVGAFAVFLISYSGHISLVGVYSLLFVSTISKQLFEAARETHSKSLTDHDAEHRIFQAHLLRGVYQAQVWGPALAFVLLRFFPDSVAIVLDALSFGVAALLCAKLTELPRVTSATGLRSLAWGRAFEAMKRKPLLRDLTLLRSIGFWIPNALLNVLLLQLVVDHFGQGLESSALFYSLLGLGAALVSGALANHRLEQRGNKLDWLGERSDATLAITGQFLYAALAPMLLVAAHFSVGLAIILGIGGAMGLNTVATQSLRRRLTTSAEFPHVVSFELVLGRLTDVIVMTGLIAALVQHRISIGFAVFLVSVGFNLSALAHLRFRVIDRSRLAP